MSGEYTKYKNLPNEAIPLCKIKTISPMPMVIITDPPEEEEKVSPADEELPTIPGGITVVQCQACMNNFGPDNTCVICQGLRLIHSMEPIVKEEAPRKRAPSQPELMMSQDEYKLLLETIGYSENTR